MGREGDLRRRMVMGGECIVMLVILVVGEGRRGLSIIPVSVSVYSRAEGCVEFGRVWEGFFFFTNHKSYRYFS